MKATIIGGGITGLATALAFEKMGIDYCLYEKAPELNEVGAGIWVSTNAMQVLNWMGIANEIIENGQSLQQIEIIDQRFRVIQSTHQKIFKEKLGFSGVAIHRGTLQKILYDHVPTKKMFWGYEAEKILENESGKVTVRFKNGSTVESELLIAADGIHSPIRKQLFHNTSLRDSGQICWRGISEMELPKNMAGKSAESWGNQLRFGFSPIGPKQVYWFAVGNKNNGSENFKKPELQKLFSSFNPLVQELIGHTPEKDIIFRPLFDLKPIENWHMERVMLVGDAAHATTPNMGQGAAQGIEDAYYLSHYLRNTTTIEAAFQIFEENRRPKVNSIVNNSWTMGKLAHIKYGQTVRNFVLKNTPSSVMERRMLHIYSLKPF